MKSSSSGGFLGFWVTRNIKGCYLELSQTSQFLPHSSERTVPPPQSHSQQKRKPTPRQESRTSGRCPLWVWIVLHRRNTDNLETCFKTNLGEKAKRETKETRQRCNHFPMKAKPKPKEIEGNVYIFPLLLSQGNEWPTQTKWVLRAFPYRLEYKILKQI